MKRPALYIVTLALLFSACSSVPAASGVATPIMMTAEVSTVIPDGGGTISTPEPTTILPTLASAFSPTELKYKVLEEFPDFFFCDPDFYPIAHENEASLALQRFPELQSNTEEFQTILKHTGLGATTTFTDEQKLLIYREHKKLNAIYFELNGDQYQFQIQTGAEGQQGTVITATIDGDGSIDILQKESSFPACPICLAAGTLIDTPHGAVRVEDLKVGDQVWTMNEAGQRVIAMILRVGNARVPVTHQMMHVRLSDGRQLWASPGHPTSNGRSLADFLVGDILDGAHVIEEELIPYDGMFTYDILSSGGTGFYWANGILMGSTLAK
jgi:hypothetical protein